MKSLFCVVVLLFAGFDAAALPFRATHYPLNSKGKAPLFTATRTESKAGGIETSQVVYTAPDGTVLATEDTETQKGRLKKYSVVKNQINESGTLTVEGGKVHFSYTKDGKTTNDEEDMRDNVVVGPTLVDYMKAHWNDILAGRDVDVGFAALDRKETVGFKLFKDSEDAKAGTVTVKMKPTSFIIAAIVDPLFFTLTRDGQRTLELKGRTLPKIKIDGKWKDLDTDSLYSY